MDDLSLGNVRPFDRPMTAGPNDRFVGRDDMGNRVYETVAGKRYSVRPATEDEGQTTRAKVEGWVDDGAPLPSWEQITDTMKAMPGAVYDSAQRSVSGDASLGELMGFAGASGAPGVASRVGTAFDPSVVSAMGATHKVPRYPKKEPVAPTPNAPPEDWTKGLLSDEELGTPAINVDPEVETFKIARTWVDSFGANDTIPVDPAWLGTTNLYDDFMTLSPYHVQEIADGGRSAKELLQIYGHYGVENAAEENIIRRAAERVAQTPEFQRVREAYEPFRGLPDERWIELNELADNELGGQRANIQFRDPLDEILSEMEIPPKGITGAQLLKELQDNPTVRMAQLRSQGILDRIDPAKRYGPVDQVRPLLLGGKYNVQAVPQNKYDSYQRQPVADKELNYVEYAINASKPDGGPTFRANSQHYQDSTLAHVRLSERENPSGNYVLIEELQSDLLQRGFVKPKQTPEAYLKNEIDASSRDEFSGAAFEIFRRVDPEDFKRYVAAVSSEGTDSEVATTFREEWDKDFVLYDTHGGSVIDELAYQYLNFGKDVALPPIAKMEESVRLGLETAIAHAAQNNIERVVIPPFHRIVEQRFTKGTAEYDKAMDPKSGFYQTYVGAVNKVLKKLNEDMGVDVEVREFDLNYGGAAPLDQRVYEALTDLSNVDYDNLVSALRRIQNNADAYTLLNPRERQSVQTFEASMWEIDPNFDTINLANQMFDGGQRRILDTLQEMYPGQSLDTPGIEINFPNAIRNGYDLTRPRFAEGGLVLSDDENRWMREFNL